MTQKLALIGVMCFLFTIGKAQNSVDINLNIKHSVGGVADFDRSKFIVLHAGIDDKEWDSDTQQKSFLEDYDVYFGRNNGSIPWEYNQTKEDPDKAGWPSIEDIKARAKSSKDSYAQNTQLHQFEDRYGRMMFGGQMSPMFPNGQETNPSSCCSSASPWAAQNYNAVAEYYANYFKEYFGEGGVNGKPLPMMMEVLNEPFVAANRFNTNNSEISKLHSVVAKRVHDVVPDIMVGGYCAAHPMFESGEFNHWNNNWKLFIDIAGKDMDFFSVHLYDYVGADFYSDEQQRKGSNIEAILDMIEAYSFLKLGKVKPFSISEYGWFGPNMDGPWNPQRDWYNVRSYSSMMMQLMERQNQIVNAIPFMILKAKWASNPAHYGPRLLRQNKEKEGESGDNWVYTEFIKFFELWKNVKGIRVDTYQSDVDILADAYVNGNIAHVIMSNLEHSKQMVNVNLLGEDENTIESVIIKHCFANTDGEPVIETTVVDHITQFELEKEATVIFEITYNHEIEISETLEEQKLYANKYFQPISSASVLSFEVNGLKKAENGEAILRLGLGRNHNLSLKPTIQFNGKVVPIAKDWKGYDQKNRDSFFGVIEIPIPYDLIAEKNTVNLKFADNGGYVTSMAIQNYQFSAPIKRDFLTDTNKPMDKDLIQVYPNPSSDVVYFSGLKNDYYNVQIFDLTGATIHQGVVSELNNTMNLSGIKSGMYLVRIEGKNRSISKRIILK